MAGQTEQLRTRGRTPGQSSTEQATRCVAVLGTGSIGMRHLALLGRMDAVRALAVPARPQRVPELAQAGYATAQGLDEAVRRGARRCVIATDSGRHLQDGLSAMDLGLEVLMEKPLATNATEAVRLARRARELQRMLFVGCVLRFSESLNTFRDLLPRVGRLHTVHIECRSHLPDWRPARAYRESYSARAEEGGVLRDLIHEIDYAGWIFGWPRAVQARLRNLGRLGIEAEEAAELSWEHPAGCAVSISLDYLSRPSRRCARAFGELGTLTWDGVEGTVTLSLVGQETQTIRSAQGRDDMDAAQVRAFLSASRKAHDPRIATGEDGVKALAVCDAARLASARRCEVEVAYP